MRWSTENENILWRTIFQTQTLNIELDKVSEAWPGNEKPTPKALKEKLDKYRSASTNVKFSMGKNPGASSPRKARTKNSTAASAIQGSPTPDDQAASTACSDVKHGSVGAFVSSATAGGDSLLDHATATATADGTRTGRGRGRSRKIPVKKTSLKKIPVKEEDDQPDADIEPEPKKTKTEGMSLLSSRARFKTKNNKRKIQPRLTNKRKFSFKSIENTEDYVRCGQGVNCGGCGKPGCAYCFSDWNGELNSPRG